MDTKLEVAHAQNESFHLAPSLLLRGFEEGDRGTGEFTLSPILPPPSEVLRPSFPRFHFKPKRTQLRRRLEIISNPQGSPALQRHPQHGLAAAFRLAHEDEIVSLGICGCALIVPPTSLAFY